MPRLSSPTLVRAQDGSPMASDQLPVLLPHHTLPSTPCSTIPEAREINGLIARTSTSQSPAGPPYGSQQHHIHNRQQSAPCTRRTSQITEHAPSQFSHTDFLRQDRRDENEFETPSLQRTVLTESALASTPHTTNALWEHCLLMSSSSMPLSRRTAPPPAPPVILTLPLPREHADGSYGSRPVPPHVPFLSSVTRDACITIEALVEEYRLIVRLPGYRLDAMYVLPRFFG